MHTSEKGTCIHSHTPAHTHIFYDDDSVREPSAYERTRRHPRHRRLCELHIYAALVEIKTYMCISAL
jgi:hypothetical protein